MNAMQIEKLDLRKNIDEMKSGSIEQMCLITMYSLGAYFKSLFTFGSTSNVTRDNLNIIKEMFKILRTERTLLNYILDNIDKFDVGAAQDVVAMLDELNDRTVIYYYDLINDIEDAAELNDEFRGRRPRNSFPTLIESGTYASEVIALSSNIDDLKSFLGFEEEFWTFINARIKTVDTSCEIMDKMAHAIPILDSNDVVTNIEILVPKIYNLQSALIAIRIYKKAYEIFKMLGKKLEVKCFEDSSSLEDEYKKEYLPRKAKDLLNLKSVK